MPSAAPALSLCMTCMGRAPSVRRALPAALAAIRGRDAELVLLDYHSRDGLLEWLATLPATQTAQLRVVSTTRPTVFHHSHAKNVAHRAARGRILANLDADTLVDARLIEWLLQRFTAGADDLMLRAHPGYGRGGFITLARESFDALAGYDETMRGWGREDPDLFLRGQAHGLQAELIPQDLLPPAAAEAHADALRTARLPRGLRAKRRSQALNGLIHRFNLRHTTAPNRFHGLEWGEPQVDPYTHRARLVAPTPTLLFHLPEDQRPPAETLPLYLPLAAGLARLLGFAASRLLAGSFAVLDGIEEVAAQQGVEELIVPHEHPGPPVALDLALPRELAAGNDPAEDAAALVAGAGHLAQQPVAHVTVARRSLPRVMAALHAATG